jgi:hypothetical protein
MLEKQFNFHCQKPSINFLLSLMSTIFHMMESEFIQILLILLNNLVPHFSKGNLAHGLRISDPRVRVES